MSLAGRDWLCGDCFSLADACAVPYMVRIGNIGLSGLWSEKADVSRWLDRARHHVEELGLEEPWGSDSFHTMVAGHVQNGQQELEEFLKALE